MRVAFLGLGVIGFPMAGHIQRGGHAVTVFNRHRDRALAWTAAYGGAEAGTIAEAVAEAELVLMCVGADADVRAVGTAALPAMRAGAVTDWMRKDLGLVLDEARRNGAHMPLVALVDQFYSEVQAMGGGRWDSSSLAARLEDRRRKP